MDLDDLVPPHARSSGKEPSSRGKPIRRRLRFRLFPRAHVVRRKSKGKRCRGCGSIRFPTALWFHKDQNRPDGYQLYCKACKRARAHASYAKRRDERLSVSRAWKDNHRDDIRAWDRAYKPAYRRGERRRDNPTPAEQDDRGRVPLKLCSGCGDSFAPRDFKGSECRTCRNKRQASYRKPELAACIDRIGDREKRVRSRSKIGNQCWPNPVTPAPTVAVARN